MDHPAENDAGCRELTCPHHGEENRRKVQHAPGTPQNPVDGATHPCSTPGYAGRHVAVGAGAISSPYVCHGCSTWFVLPERCPSMPPGMHPVMQTLAGAQYHRCRHDEGHEPPCANAEGFTWNHVTPPASTEGRNDG